MGQFAWVSGLATMIAGFAIGIPGFLRYAGLFTDTVQVAAVQSGTPSDAPLALLGPLAPLNYAFGTPSGLIATYLWLTGILRAVAGYVDDPRGDPLLTLVDGIVHRIKAGGKAVGARLARERLEGPEVPHRLMPGAWAAVDAEYVLLASRRKPGWEAGVFVLTSDKWYRIGRLWDMPLPEGLRTAYPLTEVPLGEVLRKGVDYELPDVSALSSPRCTSAHSRRSRHGD